MALRRRSIVEFEKWVDSEIKRVTEDMNGLERQVAEVRQAAALEEVRLATLKSVKQRLAIEEQADEPDAEASEPVLAFPEPEAVEAAS
jgi:hypothetical protein